MIDKNLHIGNFKDFKGVIYKLISQVFVFSRADNFGFFTIAKKNMLVKLKLLKLIKLVCLKKNYLKYSPVTQSNEGSTAK